MTGPVILGRASRTPLPLMHPQPIFQFPYFAPFECCICLEVGMTGPVILGRASRTPLP